MHQPAQRTQPRHCAQPHTTQQGCLTPTIPASTLTPQTTCPRLLQTHDTHLEPPLGLAPQLQRFRSGKRGQRPLAAALPTHGWAGVWGRQAVAAAATAGARACQRPATQTCTAQEARQGMQHVCACQQGQEVNNSCCSTAYCIRFLKNLKLQRVLTVDSHTSTHQADGSLPQQRPGGARAQGCRQAGRRQLPPISTAHLCMPRRRTAQEAACSCCCCAAGQ